MSRIRGRDTGPERIVAAAMAERGWVWEEQCRDLPGRPDFVMREQRVAIFVDGDFWHGWRFERWRDKLSETWEAKIEATRGRDRRNHRLLRKSGWIVVRIWEHQIARNLTRSIDRIARALENGHDVDH